MPTSPLRAAPPIPAAARWLVEQHRGRLPHGGFPPALAPRDLPQAYAVQDAFVALKSRRCGRPVGWKIALSNPAMQAFCGLSEPISGRVLARQVVGGPARCRAADYGRLLVEFEIAMELGADLPLDGPPITRETVAQAVAAVRPAYELADDRGADYATLSMHGLQLAADNAWNEGSVLGQRRTDWRSLDLAALRGEAIIDGEPVGAGVGADLMGHPLDALVWLAGHLRRRGHAMRAGEFAILGSLVTSKFPVAGQTLLFTLEGFAPLALRID